jgi:enoyl-CoA hydratase/3-hydroxypropionyl-coenzyme A dehydratase
VIRIQQDKGVATLTFHRPDQLNAMNRRMMDAIVEGLRQLDADRSVRVIVLTGEGKAFMAGADIKEYARQTPEQFESFQSRGRDIYASIENASKPVVAAVNGHAFGGGLEIALACDLIVASAGTKMGLPEILLNLIPGGGGTQRLPARIGLQRANELLMTGRTTTAEELRDWGLINRVWPRGSFRTEAAAFAAEIAARPPEALRVLKQLTRLAVGPVNTAAQALENEALARLYPSEGAQEKIQGFLRKSLEKENG